MSNRAKEVSLREASRDDLPIFFAYQGDPDSCRMAAVHPRDVASFDALWQDAFTNPEVIARTIVADGAVVGHIASFIADGERAVGYWIGREHWGRGCASRGLALFLEVVTQRPLHASAASSNLGSRRVLERCGFRLQGYRDSPETERYVACEEALYVVR